VLDAAAREALADPGSDLADVGRSPASPSG
jgi:hypothetical protein